MLYYQKYYFARLIKSKTKPMDNFYVLILTTKCILFSSTKWNRFHVCHILNMNDFLHYALSTSLSRRCVINVKILNSSFESRESVQKRDNGASFEVSAPQASSVTNTISGNESHFKHTLIFNFNQTVELKTDKYQKRSERLINDDTE